MAFPDLSSLVNIEDLKASCPKSRQDESCCPRWVGLNRQSDGKTWVNSRAEVVDPKSLGSLWATGQPVDNKVGYDCAYLYNGLLFSFACSGEQYDSSSSICVFSPSLVCRQWLQRWISSHRPKHRLPSSPSIAFSIPETFIYF